jgi:hypothetical protein
MAATEPTETEQYDAFISYSSHDTEFARLLEKALEAYKPPEGLDLPPHYLRIFRYEGDMTGVEYDKAIQDKIQKSAKLVIICSPAARQSQYVHDEIHRFAQAKGAEDIIPLILSGIPNNEAKPEQAAEKAFPESLCQVQKMPLAVNFLGFNPRQDKVNKGGFSNAWYNLLANLYDCSREEIEQRDHKRQLRRRNIITAISLSLFLIFAVIAAYAWRQKSMAETQTRLARGRQLQAELSEKRTAVERNFARAERNKFRAAQVPKQIKLPNREQYAATLSKRATEFESNAKKLWQEAFELQKKLWHPPPNILLEKKPDFVSGGIFSLEVVASGASYIVHYGDEKNPRFVVVEGGPRKAYKQGLRPQLLKLRDQWAPGGALPVELVAISHYDADRVEGILRLLEELKEGRDAQTLPVTINSLWFNNFMPIDDKETNKAKIRSFKDRIPQLTEELGIGLNEPFDYFVMPSEEGPAKISLDGGLKVSVIAPATEFLQNWYRNWKRTQSKYGGQDTDLVQQTAIEELNTAMAVENWSEGFSSPEIELLRAPPELITISSPRMADRSVANLTSIIMFLEYRGRKMLFCGDGRCDHIVKGLSQAGLLHPGERLHLDILMVPHWGSSHNVSLDFFKMVTADYYVICSQDRFKLPSLETLLMISEARGDEPYTILVSGDAEELPWLANNKSKKPFEAHMVYKGKETFMINLLEPSKH